MGSLQRRIERLEAAGAALSATRAIDCRALLRQRFEMIRQRARDRDHARIAAGDVGEFSRAARFALGDPSFDLAAYVRGQR